MLTQLSKSIVVLPPSSAMMSTSISALAKEKAKTKSKRFVLNILEVKLKVS